jgi:hypothetical protein
MSMSLRNELRQPLLNTTLFDTTYNWATWYDNIKTGARQINSANGNVLIFLSGMDSDITLSAPAAGTALTPSTATFQPGDFAPFSDKLVFELHNYAFTYPTNNCSDIQGLLLAAGFGPAVHPVVLTETGIPQDNSSWSGAYGKCVFDMLTTGSLAAGGWMVWTLSGSYYIRQSRQDDDETWGLTNHDWTDWRSNITIEKWLKPLVQKTLPVNATAQWINGSWSPLAAPNNSTKNSSATAVQDSRQTAFLVTAASLAILYTAI